MSRHIACMAGLAAGLLALPPVSFKASADLAISANDGKGVLINGVNTVPDNPPADNVTILDLATSPPKVLAEIKMPTSLVGPPQSVAIAPNESFALVTAATKLDPTDKKKVVPHNIVSVIDLKATPPEVIATHETGWVHRVSPSTATRHWYWSRTGTKARCQSSPSRVRR
jgi:hypothetical protein